MSTSGSSDKKPIAVHIGGGVSGNVVIGDNNQITQIQAEARLRETQGLFGVPELPKAFVSRMEDLAPIKLLLLTGEATSLGITGKALKVGMQGMGGIGKSTLAAALARDVEIQTHFPQGIFWLTIGQQPNLLNIQAQLADLLETNSHTFSDVANGKAQLERMLKERHCLLILDDVWRTEHAEPFNCLDAEAKACLLVTTRNQEVLRHLDAKSRALDVFTQEQALGMLAEWMGIDLQYLPKEAKELADECGYLPLAISMAGAMAKQKGWEHALKRLRRTDFERIEKAFPYAYPNLLRALQASLDDLQEYETLARLEARSRYLELAIFPEDTPIPINVLETLWCTGTDGLDDLDFGDLLGGLAGCALLQRDSEGTVTLHDLQRDFIVLTAKAEQTLAERQKAFLDLYLTKTVNGQWHTLPDDGYIYQHLIWHMAAAGLTEEIRHLLFDFKWLRARLEKTDINGLILDLDLSFNDSMNRSHEISYALRMVRDALRLSAHVLNQDKSQLAFQLLGRLLGFEQPEIQSLMKQIQNWKSDSLWLRPIAPCLPPPGGALIRTLSGHTGTVMAVVLTSNGKRAISSSYDSTLKFWDLETGQTLRTLSGHEGAVDAVALSVDGKRAISGSWDNTLKLWDLETGQTLHTLTGHTDYVTAVGLSVDGKQAISGSADKTLKLWDLATGQALRTFIGHTGTVISVVLAPDGKQAISGSADKTIKLWDLETGQALRTLIEQSEVVSAAMLTPDGKHAISDSDDNTIKIWDLETGQALRIPFGPAEVVTVVALTPDGKRAISGSADNTLKLWDLETGQTLRTLSGHTGTVTAVVLTPNGKRAISGSDDNTLKLWDLDAGRTLHTLPRHDDHVTAVALTPDGKRAISTSWDKTIKIWDLETGQALRTLIGHTGRVTAVALTSDGKRAISSSYDHTLKFWDLETGGALQTLIGYEWGKLVLTPDGKRAISGSDDNIKLWDLETGQTLRTLSGHDDNVTLVVLTPDGKRAISGSRDQTLRLWDLETGQALRRLIGRFTEVVLTPDGKRAIISDFYDHTLKLWDLETGQMLRTLIGHTGAVMSVVLTPDGKRAISGSYDHTLKLWDVETGQALQTLTGHDDDVTAVVLTPDGKLAISSSDDNTMKIWDLANGNCLATAYFEGKVTSLAVLPESKMIVAGDEGGNMYFLKLEGV